MEVCLYTNSEALTTTQPYSTLAAVPHQFMRMSIQGVFTWCLCDSDDTTEHSNKHGGAFVTLWI